MPRQTRSLPEPFNPRLRAQLSGVASLASEGMSMVSNGTRHKIGATAHLAASAGKSAIDAALARSSQDAVVFIIDDDDHTTFANIGSGVGYGSECHFLKSVICNLKSDLRNFS